MKNIKEITLIDLNPGFTSEKTYNSKTIQMSTDGAGVKYLCFFKR